MIVSSGLPQLIGPVLAREGVAIEVRSNDAEPDPDGWRLRFRDEGLCPVCGDKCKRRSLPDGRPLVYVGDGILRPLRRARRRPRLRPRGLAGYLRATAADVRAVRDARRRCCCAFLSRTTSRSRPSASARSGVDLANLWHEGGLHRVVGGREVRIEAAPGGVDVEPLDAAIAPRRREAARRRVRRSSRSARGRRRSRCSASSCRGSQGFRPPLAPDPFESLVTSITAQQVSLFSAFAIRNRLIERFGERGRARVRVSRPRERIAAATRGASSSRSASRAGRPSTCSASRAPSSTSTRSRLLDDDEVRARLTALRGLGPGRPSGSSRATSPGRARGRPATSSCARRPTFFYGLDVHELGPRLDPFQNLSAHYLLTGLRAP